MRTKTLLLAVAVSAAGIATSMAQTVFSQNIVGYVKVANTPGYKMISNPLTNAAGNDVQYIFVNPPNGLTLFKRNTGGTGYDSTSYDIDFGGWTDPMTLNPGEGAFGLFPAGTYTNTFTGDVVLNSTNSIPAGYSIRSSTLATSGGLTNRLNFPTVNGITIFRYNAGAYAISSFDTDAGGWTPNEPAPAVGESFWILSPTVTNWVQNFTVGP